jgi:hypothetical protein
MKIRTSHLGGEKQTRNQRSAIRDQEKQKKTKIRNRVNITTDYTD